MSDSNPQPGLVTGHAKYAQGAVNETIGQATGSADWKDSGAQQKSAGLEEMKAAGEQRQAAGGGKAEEVAGKVVGCEGMEKEGAESKTS